MKGTAIARRLTLSALVAAMALLFIVNVGTLKAEAMQILVNLVYIDGTNITVQIEPTDTIETLKKEISKKEEIAPEDQILIFAGKYLENNETLQDYSIQKDSQLSLFKKCANDDHSWRSAEYTEDDKCKVCMLPRSKDGIFLTVHIKFGSIERKLNIKADSTDSIAAVKDGISEEVGISADAQVIVFGETFLEDAKLVSEYSLKNGDAVYLYSVCKYDGHTWSEADCVKPKTCQICSVTEGDTAEHSWVEANCNTPKTCSVCKKTEGDVNPHQWIEADCITPKHCSACGVGEGEPRGHSYDNDCDRECNSCAAPRDVSGHVDPDKDMLCDRCGEKISTESPLLGVWGAVAVGVIVLAAGAAVLIFALKKKK